MIKENKKFSNLNKLNKENQRFSKLLKITKENKKSSNLNKLSTEKSFDAIKFKRQLQENSWKNSGAEDLHGYVKYANINATKSKLHRKFENK